MDHQCVDSHVVLVASKDIYKETRPHLTFDDRLRSIKAKINRRFRKSVIVEKRVRKNVASIIECKRWLNVFVRLSEHQFSRYYDWYCVRDFYFDLLNDWALSRRWADNVMRERTARASRKVVGAKVSIKSFASVNVYDSLPVESCGRVCAYVPLDADDYVPVVRNVCKFCKRVLKSDECSDDCACVWYDSSDRVRVVERERVPNFHALWKLRNKIRELRKLRSSHHIQIYCMVRKPFSRRVVPQMDIPQHGDEGGKVSVASNVVIEQESDVNPITMSTCRQDWTPYCANDHMISANELTDRWLHAGSAVWSTQQNFGTEILNLAVPFDCMKEVGDFCDTPNYTPFRITTFSHFDSIDFTFLINSNKFQTGSLIAAFIYQTNNEEQVSVRYNPYTLSQCKHVKLYAGSMNECTISIPYRNSLSMLYNQNNARVNSPLQLGRLLVYVVNKLKVGTGVSDRVNINVQMKFTGLQFSGTRPGNWPQPQMETAAALVTTTAAMKLLNTVMPDSNRDNPPLNADPSYIVPTASHSWAAGTGRVDVNKMLRLDTRGQTTHEINPEDAFTVQNLATKLGLIQCLEIPISTGITTPIFTMPVEPMFGKKVGSNKEPYEIANTYYLPPVSVISSCFAYWRGSFKVVLDIVASQFITCKLLCAYIPNVPKNQIVTRNDAFKSPHWIISIEGPKMVELEIPYITNQKWWPRSFTGNYSTVSADAPSEFYIFMYNKPLIQSSAADRFYVNLYVAGGSTFEVAVPVQPALGIGKNTMFYDNSTTFAPISGKIQDSNSLIYPYSVTVSDRVFNTVGVAERNRLKDNTITIYPKRTEFLYRARNKDSSGRLRPNRWLYIVEYKDRWPGNEQSFEYTNSVTKQTSKIVLQYGIIANSDSGSYFVPFDSKLNAYKAADQQQSEGNTNYALMPGIISYENITKDDDGFVVKFTGGQQDQNLVVLGSSASEAFEVKGENERDGVQVATLSSVRVLKSTGYGKIDFGEDFGDLMNLCRRYQKYGSIKMTGAMLDSKDKCSFFFTCNPQGLGALNLGVVGDSSQLFGRCREGPIPLLLSGYRYFRGSLRFRLVFPSCKDTLIWIQHRPDRPSRPRKLEACTNITTAQAIFNHGYASEIQLANINTIVEFEIPFYQYDAYGLLQDPDDAGVAFDYQYGLGQVFVGIQCSPDDISKFSNRNCEIYYSLADDFSPSLFYGFPKMIVLDDIPQEIQPKLFKQIMPSTSDTFEIVDRVVPQGLGDTFKAYFTKEIKGEVMDSAKELMDTEIKPAVDDVIQQVKEAVETMTTDNSVKQRILLTFTNLCHCIAHPNVKSLVITVASMLVDLGIFCFDSLKAVYSVLTKIFSKLYAHDATQHTVKGEAPNSDSGESLIASWLSLLYGGVSTIFAYKDSRKAPVGKGVSMFLKDFSFSMRGAQGVFVFIKNSFAALKQMFRFLFSRLDPTFKVLEDISTHHDIICYWIKEVIYLTDPAIVSKHSVSTNFVERVYIAHDYGQLLMSNLPTDTLTQPFYVKLSQLFKKIQDVKAQLVVAGEHPHIRKEPYGVYMYGECGVGKSQLREETCVEMLKHVNFKFKSVDVFCVIDGTQKHWDQCNHQPVLVIDDLWNVREGELLWMQISTMFKIFSDVVLTPPKAELHDKGMRYNPEIVWITSNLGHIEANNVHADAINRRRNICVEAIAYHSEFEQFQVKDCPHCLDPDTPLKDVPVQYLRDYHHLRFFVHDINRRNHFIPTESTRGNMITYSELLTLLKKDFAQNRIYESMRFERKYNRLLNIVEPVDDEMPTYSAFFTESCEVETMSFSRQLAEYKERQFKMVKALAEKHEKHWMTSVAKWTNKSYCSFADAVGKCDFTTTKRVLSKYILPKTLRKTAFEEDTDDLCSVMTKAVLGTPIIHTPPKIVIEPLRDYATLEIDDNPNYVAEITSKYIHSQKIFADVHVSALADPIEDLKLDEARLPDDEELSRIKPQADFEQIEADRELLDRNVDIPINMRLAAAEAAEHRMNERNDDVGRLNRLSVREFIPLIHANPPTNIFVRLVLANPEISLTRDVFSILNADFQLIVLNNACQLISLTDIGDAHIKPIVSVLCRYNAAGEFVAQNGYPLQDVESFIRKYGAFDRHFVNLLCNSIRSNPTLISQYSFKIEKFLSNTIIQNCNHRLSEASNFVLENRVYRDVVEDAIEHDNAESLTCRLYSPLYSKLFFKKFLSCNPSLLRQYNKGIRDFVPRNVDVNNLEVSFDFISCLISTISNSWRKTISPAIFKILKLIATYLPVLGYLGFLVGIVCAFSSSNNAAIEIMRENEKVRTDRFSETMAEIAKFSTPVFPEGAYSFVPRSGMGHNISYASIPKGQSQQATTIAPLLSKNFFKLNMVGFKTNRKMQFRCLGLMDHTALLLRHYVDTILYVVKTYPEENFEFFVELSPTFCKVGSRTIGIDFQQFKSQLVLLQSATTSYNNTKENAHKSNFVLWHLPSQIPSFRNIIKFMPSANEIHRASRDMMLINETGTERIVAQLVEHRKLLIPEYIDEKAKTEAVCIDTFWKYPKQAAGMCVTALISSNLERPLVGVHVAGVEGGSGFSEILCSEIFKDLMIQDSPAIYHQEINLDDVDISNIQFQSSLCFFGKVPGADKNSTPTKTKIIKTLIHGEFPVETEPNPLSAFDRRLPEKISPLVSGVENHGKFVRSFKQRDIVAARDDLTLKFLTSVPCTFAKPRKLTLDECVCGSGEIKYVDALNWRTSAGYPLKKFKPPTATGKKWLFNIKSEGDKHTVVSLHPKLEFQLRLDRTLRKKKIKPFTVFTDCLKDTCLPIEKCKIPGKTRIFSISPIQYTLAIREYFGCFAASFRHARFNAEHAIGINVNSNEWMELVNHLSKKGTKFVTGDYKNFGPGLELEVVRAACKVILEWCKFNNIFDSLDDEEYACILLEELIERKHLVEDLIYRPPAGAPSGSPITDILNSIVNMLYIRMSWINIVRKPLSVFNDNVSLVVYGDDLIMSVSDSFIDVFNSVSISEYFKTQNIIFTDQTKDGAIVPWRYLNSCTFLKCGFVPHPLRPMSYLAPLDIVSIHGCLNWIKGSLHVIEGTEVNIKQAMELLYGHGPDVYNKYLAILLKLCVFHGFNIHFNTWLDLDDRIYNDHYVIGNFVT